MVTRTKVNFCLAPQPLPLWNPPHPLCRKGLTQPTEMLHSRAKLLRRPCRGCWPRSERRAVLFRGERGATNDVPKGLMILQDIPLTGCPPPFKPSPPFAPQMPPPPRGEANSASPLAGTQTALPSGPTPTRVSLVVVPSVPVPARVSFVAVPPPSKRHRALSAICSANATSPEGGG